MKMNATTRYSLAAAGFTFLVGCSSLPDKAPLEFNQAKSEIEAADDEDVEEFFPKTMERASATLDNAVKMFNQADKYVDADAKSAKKGESVEEAKQAQQLATNARQAHRKLRGWDADISAFADAEKTSTRLQEVQSTLTSELSSRNNSQQEQKHSAQVPQATTQTVAHFGTNSAKLTAESRRNVREVARVLQSHNELHAEVLGYTDSRGPAEVNKRLAEQRSKAVADELQALGVEEERVTIRPLGEQYSLNNASSRGTLQLDRKVDVRLYTPESLSE